MMLSDRAEEILETLWVELVENKKDSCDAILLKDDEALKDLVSAEMIEVRDTKITLTHKGKDEARNCIRRHRLAERLFVDIFDIKSKLVHEASCKFEHLLHRGIEEHICTLLGHPKSCPHGKPVPEGSCCRDAKRTPKKLIMPLTDLDENKKAKISYLQTASQDALQKIIAMGALPKTEIVLKQKFPSYVFQIGKSQFAVDKELASCIYVRIA